MFGKKQIHFILTIIYLGLSFYLIRKIDINATEFKQYRESTSKILDGEQRLTDWKEWIGISNWTNDRVEKSENSESNANYYYQSAIQWSLILSGVSLVFLLITMAVFRGTVDFFKFLSFSFVMVAFVCLIIGLITPMMEIGAFKDLLEFPIKFNIPIIGKEVDLSKQFDGRMYFFYKNKSVFDVMHTLYEQGNYFVFSAILLFSIVNPFLKLIVTLILLFSKSSNGRIFNFIVHNLGKWSMADVFVVAIFLAFLSFQNMSTGIDTEANILFGLYYFAAFVILSIFSSMLLKFHNKRIKETIIIK